MSKHLVTVQTKSSIIGKKRVKMHSRFKRIYFT